MTSSAASDEKNPTESRKRGSAPAYVVLTGNPNCGKTTVFNALTGLRAKVGNYAGVTVERKEGKLQHAPTGTDIRVLDLPGTYSLSPNSLDEQVSRDVLLNRLPELPPPDLIVVVVDASNLQRNLYYATQVIELGHPTLIALNMVDVAETNGQSIDTKKLGEILGVPVLPLVGSTGKGILELKRKIVSLVAQASRLCVPDSAASSPTETHGRDARATISTSKLFCQFPGLFRIEAQGLAELLAETFQERRLQATAEGLLILTSENAMASSAAHYPQKIQEAVSAARIRLDAANVDWRGAPIEWRYAKVAEIQQSVTTELAPPGETLSDKLDKTLTHKVWGTIIFIVVMALMFQSIFTFAKWPMDGLQFIVGWVGGKVGGWIPPGDLNDLIVNGVIAGVGAVVVFLPQILLLFLFIGFLEDTGYMSRAAFLMDRLMSRVGLHGKSFIPMLSSYACAIPGIMATRTIESPKDRLVTILVAPLMSCSARLPVYTLLIAACIPDVKVFGFLKLAGLTMLAMYLLGTVTALIMAWIFKKTLLKGETPMLIMELPPYKMPLLKTVLRHMWDRSQMFLKRAGTVILGISILLWFLATYPKSAAIEKDFTAKRTAEVLKVTPLTPNTGEMNRLLSDLRSNPKKTATEYQVMESVDALDKEEAGEKLRHSFAGMMGRAIEPVIKPLGFDWRMGIGIVGSFAAREVFVSTMSTVYNVGNDDSDEGVKNLAQTLREQKRDDNGKPVYTTLTAVTLMVFYVFALQCVSTVAVVRRETNTWKWPLFQWLYMGALAWGFAFAVYRVGHLFGWE